MQKIEAIKSKKLRDSAKGEDCTLNIVGACNYNPKTTVLCHFPSEIAGTKSTDLSAGYGCSACHGVIDRRNPLIEISDEYREFYMRRSQYRTLHKFIEKDLIKIM